MKFYIENPSNAYVGYFNFLGEVVESPDEADTIVFTGGADVSPCLYGEEAHPKTYSIYERDMQEMSLYHRYRNKKMFVGICRGGQFLNVMNSGKLVQHIEGHGRSHNVLDWEGRVHHVTSTHHQAIVPNAMGRVLAAAGDGIVEAVWYDRTKCLCFQPHPEYDGMLDTRILFEKLLEVTICAG